MSLQERSNYTISNTSNYLITDISTGLETVCALRPVTFNWKQDIFNKNRAGSRDSGFIAQEVEQVLDHAVSE